MFYVRGFSDRANKVFNNIFSFVSNMELAIIDTDIMIAGLVTYDAVLYSKLYSKSDRKDPIDDIINKINSAKYLTLSDYNSPLSKKYNPNRVIDFDKLPDNTEKLYKKLTERDKELVGERDEGKVFLKMLSDSLTDSLTALLEAESKITVKGRIQNEIEPELILLHLYKTSADKGFIKQLLGPDNIFEYIIEQAGKHKLFSEYQRIDEVSEHIMNGIDEVYKSIIDSKANSKHKAAVKQKNEKPENNNQAIRQFCTDMVKEASTGKYEPILHRNREMAQVIEGISRKKKGNVIIIGEAGVGKTAIVQQLAIDIHENNVPEFMKGYKLYQLKTNSLIAGTMYRGEFEDRIDKLLKDISSQKDAVLFIDEIHTLYSIGGGSRKDQGISIIDILKPAMESGDIRIIGATTLSEWHTSMENDDAFCRRVQLVKVDEPGLDVAFDMIESIVPSYENHYNCTVTKLAIRASINLSSRYITGRSLPDKAIELIDTAASHIRCQGGSIVDEDAIKDVVSNITGIDIRTLDEHGKDNLKKLSNKLSESVIGQNEAIDTIAKAIRRNRVDLRDPDKPTGSFLFIGPTGVGKTELAKVLAVTLTGSVKNLIRFDMSEYSERHDISKLIGAAPGYVGYEKGGKLTEAIKHNQNAIILFDEIEKAHSDVYNIFLQILDDGTLTDASGKTVSFKNTLIIFTSNIGFDNRNYSSSIGFGRDNKSVDISNKDLNSAIDGVFKPEFINRLDKIIRLKALSEEDCKSIVRLLLSKLNYRLIEQGIDMKYKDDVVNKIVEIGYSSKFGARNIKRAIQENIEDGLADMIIEGNLTTGDTALLRVDESNIVIDVQTNIDLSLSKSKNVQMEGA